MATLEQQKAFIAEIAPCAQEGYKRFGKVMPSVCIAMACVESGYGTSKLMYNHHAVLGQKVGTGKTATKYWPKTFFTCRTSEEYTVGVHTVITDAFRSYNSIQQCVYNYYELLNTKLYSRVNAFADAFTQMEQIKLCGYMTSSTEVNSVKSIIKQFNLTQYDSITQAPVVPYMTEFKVGANYKLNYNMMIRKSPAGENAKQCDITDNAKLHAKFDKDGNAILKKGTTVTCKGSEEKNGSIWVKIPSGWICGSSSEGTIYIS